MPKPKADALIEAQATKLNSRGEPYRLWDMEFAPDTWVPVTPTQAEQLGWMDWAKLRPREDTG
jgi:hypothetical protein